MSGFDQRALRSAFGQFMTGVTVVTALSDDKTPVGFTANSFASVSLDPPLVLVCPGRFLSSFDTFASCDTFAISILAEGQEEVSNTFATSKGDRFAQVPTLRDCHDVPLIRDAVASFSCKTHKIVDAGDHIVLIGEVVAFTSSERLGLGYHVGRYFSLGLERSARAASARKNVCGAIIQALDTVLLEPTPDGFQPPHVDLPDRGDLVPSLARFLSQQGIDAEIGPVYSVFDDPHEGIHYAFLLASAHIPMPDDGPSQHIQLQAVPIADLAAQRFATPAIAKLMGRFAREAQTRDFSLYLGDTERGDTQRMRDDSGV